MTSFFDKARLAAEEASRELTERAKAEAPGAKERAKVIADQAQSGAKEMAGQARRQFVTAIEKIDPGILADVVIKATALQEKANASLRGKRSAYRIAEIVVTATIPPQISFGIHAHPRSRDRGARADHRLGRAHRVGRRRRRTGGRHRPRCLGRA